MDLENILNHVMWLFLKFVNISLMVDFTWLLNIHTFILPLVKAYREKEKKAD